VIPLGAQRYAEVPHYAAARHSLAAWRSLPGAALAKSRALDDAGRAPGC
jgi:hypothetical protein